MAPQRPREGGGPEGFRAPRDGASGLGRCEGLQLKGEVWDCLRRQQCGVTDAGLQVYVPSVKDGSSVRAGIKLPGDRWAGW